VTQGIVFFAYNTEQINYLKLSTVAAHYASRHMPDLPICLITSVGDWEWFKKNFQGDFAIINDSFDEIVLAEPGHQDNPRTHHDSPWSKFVSQFRNKNKHRVIDYTPFDKTLLLDIDYIIQNNQLEYVFDTDSAVTLFHDAETLIGERPGQAQQRLHTYGIPMLWSTVIYFNRNKDLSRMFFDTWAHVAENYEFYCFLYGFPGHIFRTDFCVSIATHIINGMREGEIIEDFSRPMIYMSQRDDIVHINEADDWVYLVNDRQAAWENSLTRIMNENVHVMNKRAIERHYDDIMMLIRNNK